MNFQSVLLQGMKGEFKSKKLKIFLTSSFTYSEQNFPLKCLANLLLFKLQKLEYRYFPFIHLLMYEICCINSNSFPVFFDGRQQIYTVFPDQVKNM